MQKNQIDIIVDGDGRIVATSPAGSGYQIEPVAGHKKHTVELPEHITNTNASEFHAVISRLLYFEKGAARIRELRKKK